jgi:hypothetical protein
MSNKFSGEPFPLTATDYGPSTRTLTIRASKFHEITPSAPAKRCGRGDGDIPEGAQIYSISPACFPLVPDIKTRQAGYIDLAAS